MYLQICSIPNVILLRNWQDFTHFDPHFNHTRMPQKEFDIEICQTLMLPLDLLCGITCMYKLLASNQYFQKISNILSILTLLSHLPPLKGTM